MIIVLWLTVVTFLFSFVFDFLLLLFILISPPPLYLLIQEYYVSRATSSIPASLIAHVPLVTSGQFLNIYPCLRDAPIHRKMAWGNQGNNDTILGADYGTGLKEGDTMSNDTLIKNSGNVPRNILGNTECEAMEVAVRLTAEEYSQAKQEIIYCSSHFWNQAKEAFRSAAEKNKKVKLRKQTDL